MEKLSTNTDIKNNVIVKLSVFIQNCTLTFSQKHFKPTKI